MVVIAFFILLSIMALYLSSLSTLQGLQNLNTANNLLNLNMQIMETVNSVEKNLDKLNAQDDFSERQYIYQTNHKLITELMGESFKQADHYPELNGLLRNTSDAIALFDAQRKMIIKKLLEKSAAEGKKNSGETMAEMLIARQLMLDSKESLRKIQIYIKQENDRKFLRIYERRFIPLKVTGVLAVVFLCFVTISGLLITKRVSKSIYNLLSATDRVAEGNLDYQVSILEHDEIGKLTSAFNQMTFSLKNNKDKLTKAIDRTTRLQAITAAFSQALTPEQVYDIIFKQAFESLGALAGAIVLLSEDENNLELKRLEGQSEDVYLRWKKIPLSSEVPVSQVVRFKLPLFITAAELINYKDVDINNVEISFHSEHAFAFLPLVISSEAFGAISFSFPSSKIFDQEEKDFLMALASQCAQAIHRSQLYDNAKKAIEARDEFLSIASHELRTPLTPLKLQIQSISRQLKSGTLETITPERLQRMAEISDNQINRLSTLIDDLLDVSRITSGKFNFKKEFFSLKLMIQEVLKQYSQQLSDTHSVPDLVVEQDTVGYWDKLRIEQVFINLLTNASKYAPNRPIHIRVTNEFHLAKIKIRDEGRGIAPEDRERIFNRFERVASRENVGGLGLGLYISKQIVEAHQGRIYVEESSQAGTVFTVELPEEKLI
jgi:signal transduction histidine kinase/HAMP domain-containing protein